MPAPHENLDPTQLSGIWCFEAKNIGKRINVSKIPGRRSGEHAGNTGKLVGRP